MAGASKKAKKQIGQTKARKEYDSYTADKTQDLNASRQAYLDFKAELDDRKQKMADGASAYEAKQAQWMEKNSSRIQELKDRHGVHVDPNTGRRTTSNYMHGHGSDYDSGRSLKYFEKYKDVKNKDGTPVIDEAHAERMMKNALAYGDADAQRAVHDALKAAGFDPGYDEMKAIEAANQISEEEIAKEANLKAAYDEDSQEMLSFEEWKKANYDESSEPYDAEDLKKRFKAAKAGLL